MMRHIRDWWRAIIWIMVFAVIFLIMRYAALKAYLIWQSFSR